MNESSFTDPSGSLEPGLNPRYTFSGFIVGRNNRMAHAASVGVADSPGVDYNPLFLYGSTGIGKTHLLHAIGHHAVQNGLKVLYVSAETFTNEVAHAIREYSIEAFRAKYRSVDVLLVDDIQFIAGKESVEEEFFQIFNSLYESSKQIVMCSDRPPKAIKMLQERLRSRFEWGLIADMQPLSQGERAVVLRAMVDSMQREVPNEVIEFVALLVQTNIRKLEESLNRVLVYAEQHKVPLTIEVARLALQNELNESYGLE